MPFRSEVTVTEYCPVMVSMPYVGHTRHTFWNEHAVIPVVFCRLVRQSAFGRRSPAEDFFDDGAHVRKPWSICECRETRTADHDIKFGLRSALHFRERHHRERPPHQRARSSLETSTTEIHHHFRTFSLNRGRNDYILHLPGEKCHFSLRHAVAIALLYQRCAETWTDLSSCLLELDMIMMLAARTF